jgi:hypothetical protein
VAGAAVEREAVPIRGDDSAHAVSVRATASNTARGV